MVDKLAKRLAGPLKPWLKSRLGEDYTLWANWAQARIQRLQRRTGQYRGTRYVWLQPGHSTLERFDLVGPGRGELLIETRFSGVSPGTEIANFAVLPNTSPTFPSSPGYSAIGTVVAIGGGVSGFKKGDLVATMSGHASIATVKATEVAKVPNGLGPSASLHTMALIAWHGVHLADVREGETVIVLGRGIIGQFATQIVKLKKPSKLVSVARSMAFAGDSLKRFCDSVEELDEALASDFRADVVFEVTGSPHALEAAAGLVRDGGRIVLLGSSRGTTPAVDFAGLALRRVELIGAHTATLTSCAKPGEYDAQTVRRDVLRGFGDGSLDADGLVDAIRSPEEAPELYLRLADDRDRALGLVFDWDRLTSSRRLERIGFFAAPVHPPRARLTPPALEFPQETCARPSFRVADQPVRIAIIGAGVQGRLNAADVAAAEGAELVAVMDANQSLAERLASDHGVVSYSDYDHVLGNPDVDAVFLSTPHHLHRPQAEAAARAGKHVLVEKPVAANFADAVALVQACEVAGVKLATWLGYRYNPPVAEARRLIKAGALGALRSAELSYHIYKPLSYYRVSGWRAHRETAGGGVLIMNGIHFLDALLWLADEPPVEVSAAYATLAGAGSEVEDTLSMWIRFAGGALASVLVSSCSMGMADAGPMIKLFGQDGSLVVGRSSQLYTLKSGIGYAPGVWQPLSPVPAMKSIGVEMVERFASAVRSGEPMEISGRDGLIVQGVIEAAYRSMELKRPVKLSEMEETA